MLWARITLIIVKAVSGLTAEQSLPSAPTMTLRTGAITPWSRPEHSTASLWVQKLFSSADTEINTRRVAFMVTRGYNGMIGIRLCFHHYALVLTIEYLPTGKQYSTWQIKKEAIFSSLLISQIIEIYFILKKCELVQKMLYNN